WGGNQGTFGVGAAGEGLWSRSVGWCNGILRCRSLWRRRFLPRLGGHLDWQIQNVLLFLQCPVRPNGRRNQCVGLLRWWPGTLGRAQRWFWSQGATLW